MKELPLGKNTTLSALPQVNQFHYTLLNNKKMKHKKVYKKTKNELLMKLLDIYTFLTPFPTYFIPAFKTEMQLCFPNNWHTFSRLNFLSSQNMKNGFESSQWKKKNQIIWNESVLRLHLKSEHQCRKYILWFCCCKSKYTSPVPFEYGHFTYSSHRIEETLAYQVSKWR